jgi:hypothetical protein
MEEQEFLMDFLCSFILVGTSRFLSLMCRSLTVNGQLILRSAMRFAVPLFHFVNIILFYIDMLEGTAHLDIERLWWQAGDVKGLLLLTHIVIKIGAHFWDRGYRFPTYFTTE